MKVTIIDTYYPNALESLGFAGHVHLVGSYAENLQRLLTAGFGTGAAYARALNAQGVSVEVIVPNALGLQELWAKENGKKPPIRAGWKYGIHLSRLPIVRSFVEKLPHMHKVLLEQIATFAPDVLFIQDINFVPKNLLARLKKIVPVVTGEIASPPPPKQYFTGYDTVFSALPSIVEQLHTWGIPSVYIPLACDADRGYGKPASQRDIDVIFVGSFSRHQAATLPLLSAVARRVPQLQIYGPADMREITKYGLIDQYKGQAWGEDMWALLRRSKIVLNRHGEIAGDYAVNMRMFEATGSGCVLVTENKGNLSELFVPEEEVISYDSPEKAAGLIQDLLADPKRLDRIAQAGHRKTMSQHTYNQRAQRLVTEWTKLLAQSSELS